MVIEYVNKVKHKIKYYGFLYLQTMLRFESQVVTTFDSI